MAETPNIVSGIIAILAVLIAIFSTPLRKDLGDALLFLIEISLVVIIVMIAIYGQKISKS